MFQDDSSAPGGPWVVRHPDGLNLHEQNSKPPSYVESYTRTILFLLSLIHKAFAAKLAPVGEPCHLSLEGAFASGVF